MRLLVLAIGRLGRGPEAELVRDYLDRATAVGRSLGLGPAEVMELEPRRTGKAAEGEALMAALDGLGGGALHVAACDEHGRIETSRAFAAQLGALRDRGVRRTAFLIGGADGLASEVLARAEARLSFGAWTWPHALARVMLAEQIYRATTLLAGQPYHRD